jgi:hypothetical protein
LINRRLRRLELSLSDNGSVVIEHAECGGPIAYYGSSGSIVDRLQELAVAT